MAPISRVGSVLSVSCCVSVRYLGRFMGLKGFQLELVSWFDMGVSARLCLGIWIWWGRPKYGGVWTMQVPGIGLQ